MSSDKEIVIVTPWFGAFAGGAESLAKGLARELPKRGISTRVLTTCSLSPYDDWWADHHEPGVYEIEGIEVERFRTNKTSAPYQEAVAKLGERKSLTANDQENCFAYGVNSNDLVNAVKRLLDERHEILALPYFYGLTHAVVNRYPGHVSVIPCFHAEPQFYWEASRRLLRNAKHVFYNSPEEKDMTIRQHGRIVGRSVVEGPVTGVGVELSRTDSPLQTGASLPAKYFVYAGRKEKGKNVPLLCEWFRGYARAQKNGSKLVFVGGGDSALVPQDDCFVDVGFAPEVTKQQVISGATAMINLSQNESFSIVLMEAWLLGIPAIVSANCPVMRGHVRRSDGGLYVENAEEFCAALEYVEDNSAMRAKLADNGRSYVSRNFSFDLVLSRYLNHLANGSHHWRDQSVAAL
jgi:glycosyltransferase involved in cell wall biosynthesis